MILNTCYKYRTSRGDHMIHCVLSVNAELMTIYVCKCVNNMYVYETHILYVYNVFITIKQ